MNRYYHVRKMNEPVRKLSFEDMWLDAEALMRKIDRMENSYKVNRTFTRTLATTFPTPLQKYVVNGYINQLQQLYERGEHFDIEDKHQLYHSFCIPKKNGKLRHINAPNDDFKMFLNEVKNTFEDIMNGCTYHTSAFAYVKGRSTIDAVKQHQGKASRWFTKLDFSDFFGSTTIEFVLKMFSRIYPWNYVMSTENGLQVMEKLLGLCFLDGGLPQGTPMSPIITNIMMIPIDFRIANDLIATEKLTNYNFSWKAGENNVTTHDFCYTRYADDMIISARYWYDNQTLVKYIKDIIAEFEAPFTLNDKKTRFGSSAGQNWNLGVMLNKDNEITIGHKKKKQFKSMLVNYMTSRGTAESWSLEDIQILQGLISYYLMVEKENINAILDSYSIKFGDIRRAIRADINGWR